MQAAITEPMGTSQANDQVALLDVSRADGWKAQHRLDIGGIVIAGSSDRCGLSLSGDDIAAMHCSLRRDETGIWLTDWESENGTFLDGDPVNVETQVPPGSTIRLGPYTIELQFSGQGQMNESESADTSHIAATQQEATTPAPRERLSLPAEAARREDPLGAFPVRAHVPSVERLPATGVVEAVDAAPSEQHREEQESCDLLRAEVEQLQYELAERDAQLAELMEPLGASETRPDESSSDQLFGRIEELLDELDRSDARMVTLEELLVAAEEANCAEREERRQLESWVADIEAVVSEHDKARSAEVETLKQTVSTLVAEREELMQQLSRPASEDHSEQADAEEVTRLRVQISHLDQQLHDANAAATRAEEELRLREAQLAEATDAKRALREEQLKMAEERAALARLRAELTAAQAELPTRSPDARTDVDNRVRVFRQHLREIHEQEQQENNSRRLSTRIAQLWRNVEQRR